jgi:hypothetical protein
MAKGGAAATMGALGSVAAFGAIITDAAAQVNALSRAAKDVNMPGGDLQALRLQAQMAGAETEDMDAAIKEMSLRWGEMKSLGSGAMNDYFKDTGNKQAYKDLKNAKNSMEAYQVIVREIAKEKDAAKQNFMADEFFGGDSEKMLSVLKSGTEGLSKAKQALRDTGGPIDNNALKAASEYSAGLKKLLRIFDSLKTSALTPVMKELSTVFSDIAEKMKNIKWRNKAIAELRDKVSSLFAMFKSLGGGVLFLIDNFKGIIATIALLKIGFIALNLAMYANPIGLIVAGIAAAVVAVTYLIDKFDVLGKIMGAAKDLFGWGDDGDEALKKVSEISGKMDELNGKRAELGVSTNGIINGDESLKKIDEISAKMEGLNGKRAELGVSTNDVINTKSMTTFGQIGEDPALRQMLELRGKAKQLGVIPPLTQKAANQQPAGGASDLSRLSPMQPITPLMNHSVQSQSEVALTIKSDKPVFVDKAQSDKGTSLSIDVGNMMMSY